MKREELIKILQEEYPKEVASEDDFIGLQITGSNEIKKIFITLDMTLGAIEQAIDKKADFIITHHPIFYGEEEELIKKDALLRDKVNLLKKLKINVFVIHTNADFNPVSIAYAQALQLNAIEIQQLNDNLGISASLKEKTSLNQLIKIIKRTFNINNYIRSNIYNDELKIDKIIIGSGAAGDLLYNPKLKNNIFLIGEMKYHNWIFANDNNIKVIEIGHKTEEIFTELVENFLKEENVNSISGIYIYKDENVYRTI